MDVGGILADYERFDRLDLLGIHDGGVWSVEKMRSGSVLER
jgi:hypothetical protein